MHLLKPDICNIRDWSKMNSDIDDLENRKAEYLSGDLQYACWYWALQFSQCVSLKSLLPLVRSFLFTLVLYWLEVLSLSGNLLGGLNALQSVQAKHLVRGAYHMAWVVSLNLNMAHFSVVSQGVPQRFP